ncbi:DnaB-like helicase C-terminal domain-containing protein [Streptomyces sp. NPDC050448]|uniref:DnaB-like helicase C-terminal domain-containing protein n=1 Tax=Streptomyces sp. NPDC050448 TaxID=3155404 RepID=UPI00341F631A
MPNRAGERSYAWNGPFRRAASASGICRRHPCSIRWTAKNAHPGITSNEGGVFGLAYDSTARRCCVVPRRPRPDRGPRRPGRPPRPRGLHRRRPSRSPRRDPPGPDSHSTGPPPRRTRRLRSPLYIQDDHYANFSDLRAHCRRLHARHGPGMIVIDKLQLIPHGTQRRTSRYEEVSDICLGLTRLAKELQIPVLAVSTLSRGPELRTDKEPVISDLRDSGALEDNADLVILIHRGDAYEKDSPRAGEADLINAKHRYGPTATLTVAHQDHYGRFVDMSN